MNRYVNEPALMTLEEAQRLSDPRTSLDANEERRRIWAWQSVEGVIAQSMTNEQIEKMERLARRKQKA
jgi:hypothetical protein